MPGELGVGLRPVVVLRADPPPVRVHRVVAAPQDAVVGREPEVVEPVAGVRQTLAAAPADRGQLPGCERFGHQRVVVDRDGVRAHAADEVREDVGAEGHLPGADGAVRGADRQAGAVRTQAERGCVLVEPDAQGEAGALEAPGQAGRVQQGDAAAVVQAGQEGRRVDLGAHLLRVQELDAVGQPEAAQAGVPLPQPVGLVRRGGDVDLAGALEGAVEGVPGDGLLDRVEVAGAQLLQDGDLVRPAGESVGESVGEGGGAEAAVAAGGGPARLTALDEDDVAAGVALLGQERGPQSAVAAADDEEVAGLGRGEGRLGARPAGVVQPVRHRPDVGEGCGPTGHGARGHDCQLPTYA